jgi:hypothetical protein
MTIMSFTLTVRPTKRVFHVRRVKAVENAPFARGLVNLVPSALAMLAMIILVVEFARLAGVSVSIR